MSFEFKKWNSFIKPDYILVRQKVVKRLKDKLYRLNEIQDSKFKVPNSKILAIINSYYGHFQHAFSFNLRKNTYECQLGNMQKLFFPNFNYMSLYLSMGNVEEVC